MLAGVEGNLARPRGRPNQQQVLSLLLLVPKWRARRDSNSRPTAPEAAALSS